MRAIAALLCVPLLAAAQDAREIVRRACDLDRKNEAVIRNYTYLQRQDESDLDGSGNVKTRQIRTFEVSWLEGSPYRRLVARNDKPLSPGEQQQEEEKYKREGDQRARENAEQRKRRIGEYEGRQQRQRGPVRELPDAFNFRMAGEERLNGADTWVIDATPKPGYKPRASNAAFLPKVKARFWISKDDYQWVKVDMESVDTISLGAILVRIGKGGHLVIEQTRVNNEVWLPKHASLSAAARILLVKGMRKNLDYTFSDYKKFQAHSRVVETGPEK